ncbi:MAG: flagellar basal-body MS-ring/collar protein FliF [Acidimicrobiales bacterium]|nr:flagellar basal-body MS-ring/collar protein FliF [Acidimicrobiales bacterium]
MAGFDLVSLKERASSLNATYTKGQKALMAGAVVAVFAGVFLFTRLAGEGEYAALYTNLEPADAAAVTEQLSAEGIPYRLENGGTTVQVPRGELYETRIRLSADGLPAGGSAGWSILDDQGITASEFSQRVGYQRALEGELARTIRSIDAIEGATVHLALPRDTAFALNDREASASVLVSTRAGTTLDGGQVQGIVNLVASSVDRLGPGQITVADSTGMVLAAPGQRSVDYAGNDMNMRQVNAFEESVASELQAMLTSVVGPGKAVVNVTAELDFDEQTVTRELYEDVADEDGGRVALEEQVRNEEYTGPGQAATGVLGPDGEAVDAEGPPTEYTLDESNVVFGVNRIVEATNRAPGKVTRMSVAVLVDEETVTPEMVDQIEQVVTAGADIRPDRGDLLAVSAMPFDTSVADQMAADLAEADDTAASEAQMQLYQTIALVVVVLIVLALGYRTMRKAAKRRAALADSIEMRAIERAAPDSLTPAQMARVNEAADAHTAAGNSLDLVSLNNLIGGVGTPTVESEATVANEVAEMIDNQPDEVAQLLRGWLGDRRGAGR